MSQSEKGAEPQRSVSLLVQSVGCASHRIGPLSRPVLSIPAIPALVVDCPRRRHAMPCHAMRVASRRRGGWEWDGQRVHSGRRWTTELDERTRREKHSTATFRWCRIASHRIAPDRSSITEVSQKNKTAQPKRSRTDGKENRRTDWRVSDDRKVSVRTIAAGAVLSERDCHRAI